MNTRTENRPPVSDHRSTAPSSTPPPKAGLSLAQTVGGSLAAATAAALGSRLGFVGTISGAAVASVISAVAGALYTNSLRHTGDRVSSALRTVRGERPLPSDASRVARRVLVGAVTVFALAAVAVTGFEAVSGRSLDGDSGGTTVGRTVEGTSGSSGGSRGHVTPTPASTPTTTSSPSATSPTAPYPSPSATATEGSGSEATPSGEPSPTSSPSDGSSSGTDPTAEPTDTSTVEPTDVGSEGAAPEPLTP